MREKGKAVRLTDVAHWRLAEMAEDYNSSQKEIASEAIILLTKRESIDKELRVARADVFRLENKIRENKLYGFGTFLLGAVTGGALVFGILVGLIL